MSERTDLLESLRKHRELFLLTVRGLTDDQARSAPTASELTLGGLVKHVASTEQEWTRFVLDGPADQNQVDWLDIDWTDPPPEVKARQEGFRLLEGETLDGVVADYRAVASVTDRLVETTDLDATQPLPEAPWFEPGASWSARRVFLHVVAETAQHAGHADIIRESIDGQKSMG
ncbi:hypothetical protein ASD11_00475 [Aeromicrobium sp. Root495]|uniref:DinB family protein n=1 Tax=Aeromicrobium sp. Root495 TaxID=1736550 RepID=UPI0006F45FB1|nr:DinB family protein [Aeromicrobium sp. Root495]KQY58181.1 hypothetical protein ASD11_00475 [Aeromicrobium sp. Root495]RYJ05576.1 MAG: DinB family protein [Actinomycetales bacterium]